MYKDIIEERLNLYWRAANYLTVAQIFLKDNILLQRSLEFSDLKDRISGHWGTSPGINYIYAHINMFIKKFPRDIAVIIGVGHAGAALMSNLYLDGTLHKYYGNCDFSNQGILNFVNLCGSGGIRSEINPQMPGTVYDGGELGYSLSTAQGLVMDKKNLVCFCIIGDGEFESGTITSSLLSGRVLWDDNSGIVVPIIHLNGYKMGNSSILSLMSDDEIRDYFSGLGYFPLIVKANYEDMVKAFDQIEKILKKIQQKKTFKHCPVLIVKSEKGWSMPINEEYAYVGINSHKVPIKDVKTNYKSLQYLEKWLRSYKPEEIFFDKGGINQEIFFVLPKEEFRIGNCINRVLKKGLSDFDLPNLNKYRYRKGDIKSNIDGVDQYLYDIVNQSINFRIISPDELQSNKFEMLVESSNSGNKKIIEVLNECICMGWQQGYLRSGGMALMISYESFMPIITSMVAQYEKYVYQSNLLSWRGEIGSLNFLLTSLWWSNTYSHQNPEFINSLIAKEWDFINIYFPVDGNTFLTTMEMILKSKGKINTVIINKNPTMQLTSLNEAYDALESGVINWNKDKENVTYEIVVILIGECAIVEGLSCKEWSDKNISNINILYLSLIELMSLNREKGLYNFLEKVKSNAYIIFVFHGYQSAIKQLINKKLCSYKISILGYQDRCIVSGPIELKLVSNNLSKYDIELKIVDFLYDNTRISIKKWEKLHDDILRNKQEILNKYYDKSSKF